MPSPAVRKRRAPPKKKPAAADHAGAGHDTTGSMKTKAPMHAPSIRMPTQEMERIISRIIYLRFQQDVARLFSTHLNYVAHLHLPKLFSSIMLVSGPGWLAVNRDCESIKDCLYILFGFSVLFTVMHKNRFPWSTCDGPQRSWGPCRCKELGVVL
jgi:RNA polymerase II-associated protein 3